MQQVQERTSVAVPALCIPPAVEHYGGCSSHLSPGHRAQQGHTKGSVQQVAAVVYNFDQDFDVLKIFCLFIFTVKSKTNVFQIPKAKSSSH